ncbi:MAG: hypothetical protein JWQ54_2991 [Mucilaginibacter sp.]|nr:hypothetical protein [Mucilaginibacter sp.]
MCKYADMRMKNKGVDVDITSNGAFAHPKFAHSHICTSEIRTSLLISQSLNGIKPGCFFGRVKAGY